MLHIAIVGDTSSGKTCFAAALLKILRPHRPQAVLIPEPGQGQTWLAEESGRTPPQLVRLKTVDRALEVIAQNATGSVVVDTTTELHRWLREGWLTTYQEERDRLNLRVPESMPVQGWTAVNEALEDLRSEADKRDVHLIQVYRRGPHYVALDDGSGVAETEHGLRSRGPSEGGRGGDLIFRMDGGMPSRHRRAGDRVAEVIKDTSGLAVGVEISLPEFRGRGDRQELVRRIRQAIGPSLLRCAEIRQQEIEAWRLVKEGGGDWQTARKLAQQSESERLVEVARQMLAVAGLDGQANTIKAKRGTVLEQAFGTGYSSIPTLKDLPLAVLDAGVRKLQPLLLIDEVQAIKIPTAQKGGEQAASQAADSDASPKPGKPTTGRKAPTKRTKTP